MQKILVILACCFFASGCSVPLISSFTSSGVTGMATGKYQESLLRTGVDVIVHQSTGKTTNEHILDSISVKQANGKRG